MKNNEPILIWLYVYNKEYTLYKFQKLLNTDDIIFLIHYYIERKFSI